MPSFNDISTLSLGNTFGAWYSKTNDIINQLNLLDVASITGGDGIQVLSRPSPYTGGYTVEFSGNVTKNTTFSGNVNIAGTLTYGSLNSQMVSTELTLPFETGVTVGNIVYMKPSGLLAKAQANDECTAEVVGIVKGISGSQATVLTTGKVSGASMAQLLTGITGATFIPGSVYFLSEGISGIGTTLEPNVVDYVSKPVVLGLTGDTALILPYRGFIAYYGTGGNSTTVVSGVCGAVAGVLSINGITAALYNTTIGPQYRRTSGHLHAMNSLNIGFDYAPSTTAQIPISGIGSYTIVTPARKLSYSLLPYKYEKLNQSTTTTNSTSTTHTLNSIDEPFFDLFSTSGISGDCYKLIDIRLKNLQTIFSSGIHSHNFSLKRVFNFASGTMLQEFDPSTDSGEYVMAPGINGPGTDIVIEYKMKTYTAYGRGFASDTLVNWQQHPSGTVTPSKQLFTPIYRMVPIGFPSGITLNSFGATASLIDGTIDSSGEYPIHFVGSQPMMAGGRTQLWNFNSVVLDDPSVISRSVETVLRNRWYWNTSATLGLTLSSDIIGHIRGLTQEGGAVAETLCINFPSYIYRIAISEDYTTPLYMNVQLSLCKYNPTTGVTSNPFIISKDICYTPTQYKLSGRTTTVLGS